MMPERVKKLEGQILGLSSQVEDLQSNVCQLVQILKQATAPKGNDIMPMKNGKYIF
jgi:DNA-binding FrmR family transcriptional regulator